MNCFHGIGALNTVTPLLHSPRCQSGGYIFSNRGTLVEKIEPPALLGVRLDPETHHDAKALAPGWDVYYLEQEWRSWMLEGGLDAPRDPDKAFLGFCKRWFEKRGRP